MEASDWLGTTTHIRVLLVNAGNALEEPILLLVLIRDERVGLDVSMYNLEARLVGDAVAIPESGRNGGMLSDHVIEVAARQEYRNKLSL